MIKSKQNKAGVKGIITLTKKINPDIGIYKEHFLIENFEFIVNLTNGSLKMSVEIAQDYEAQPNSITNERVINVAKTFVKFLK